ncbi:MAG: hypothetical protein M3384_08200 [Acidobacteriota bacterium]|nr:hypothetical protein [Acidobacteriota bacterium]
MADDNSTQNATGDARKDRKFPVIGCVLVILLILALFAVIFFYGQFAAFPNSSNSGVGP